MTESDRSSVQPWERNWKIERTLTPGGQGQTYHVVPITCPGSPAVLKVLHRQNDAKARARMRQEVTNLEILNTTGGKVPKVLEHNTEQFKEDAIPLYFVMEYIPGATLGHEVEKAGSVPLETAVNLVLTLCQTMRIAHGQNILHRDIKPENIIVRDLVASDAVMIDYGLSFNTAEVTQLTSIGETIENSFLSLPERHISGDDRRDPRSDVTYLCAILHYCLTGCRPGNLLDSRGMQPHQREPYKLDNKVPGRQRLTLLNGLFSRGFSYSINDRFQSVDELQGRLKEILAAPADRAREDLLSVAKLESERLTKNNRRVQLDIYRKACNHVGSELANYINKLQGKLGRFHVVPSGWCKWSRDEHKANADVILLWSANLIVEAVEKLQLGIFYAISSKGAECSVYRNTVISHDPARQKVKELEHTIVLRYRGDQPPDASVIIEDFEDCLARCMRSVPDDAN